jgi:hypothetical protein
VPAARPRGRKGTGVVIISPVAWLASLPAGVLVAGGVGFALLLAFIARLALLGYLHATRAYEWNGGNAAQGDDAATANALAKLEIAVRTQAARPALGTPTSSELLASLDALNNDRRARLAAASHELPVWPDRDESTRASVGAVIAAQAEQTRNSGNVPTQRRRSGPV